LKLLDGIVKRGSLSMANRTADILGQMFNLESIDIVEDSP